MTTPYIPRRAFLRTLGLAAVAPFVAARLLASRSAAQTATPSGFPIGLVYDTKAADEIAAFGGTGISVNGATIKVPSNRWPQFLLGEAGRPPASYLYSGDWDGTFKDEAGCTNPAYILAHLTENTRKVRPDWATGVKRPGREGLMPVYDLDWHALYHWGEACDEMVLDFETENFNPRWDGGTPDSNWGPRVPRHQINTFVRTRAEQDDLRGHLRMCFIAWKAQDERYRTSWPGIPHPES